MDCPKNNFKGRYTLQDIPTSLWAKLKIHCFESGKNQSQVILEALKKFLDDKGV